MINDNPILSSVIIVNNKCVNKPPISKINFLIFFFSLCYNDREKKL